MARDADGRAKVHLANVRSTAQRRRSGLFAKSRPSGGAQPAQSGVVSVETRGRRSTSQRLRDASEQMRSIGTLFDGAPKLLETVFTAGFVGLVVYFLRPQIRVFGAQPGTTGVFWGDKEVERVEVNYPERGTVLNLSVLVGLIAVGGQGDLGSLLAPAAGAGIFHKLVDLEFDNNPHVYPAYDLRVLTWPGEPSMFPYRDTPVQGPYDARADFYMKAVLPRYLKALMIAFFFYFVLRYIRHVGT